MKLHEQKSCENYSCGICSVEVKQGEFHHNHDGYINGRTWGFEALLKQIPSRAKRLQYYKENPRTKKERAEERKR
jgi:hypothetical protein